MPQILFGNQFFWGSKFPAPHTANFPPTTHPPLNKWVCPAWRSVRAVWQSGGVHVEMEPWGRQNSHVLLEQRWHNILIQRGGSLYCTYYLYRWWCLGQDARLLQSMLLVNKQINSYIYWRKKSSCYVHHTEYVVLFRWLLWLALQLSESGDCTSVVP